MAQFYNGFMFDASTVAMRYGKHNEPIDYKTIALIDDEQERNKQVDMLVSSLIADSENTGFFRPDDIIYINRLLGNAIKVDDNEIYYQFFNMLNARFKEFPDKPTGAIVMRSITDTVYDYFGKFDGDYKKRNSLTSGYFDDNDDLVIPSIRDIKGQNAAACVEYSALAHNLWLLTGVTSYFVLSKDAAFEGSNDGHAFVIVEYGEKFRLFDLAQEVAGLLQGNPIETLQNNKPFIVNNMVYANASSIKKPGGPK